MPKSLSTKAQSQLDRKAITRSFNIHINDVVNNDVISYSQDFSSEFGIAAFSVALNNDGGIYSKNGSSEIKLSNTVKLKERFYATGSDEFTNFTGYVRQREISHSKGVNTITLTCLDLLCKLEETDIAHKFEATKIQVTNETLTPVFLPEPNENMATIFNFAHEALANEPPITVVIKDLNTNLEYAQEAGNGFEINYETGQLILGSTINAKYNYSVICKAYYFYAVGLYIEDILEDIICEPDGYGSFLFNEISKANLIANHLTETFYNVEAKAYDTMLPNYSTQTKTIKTSLTVACSAGDTSITVSDTSGFPTAGTGDMNGDVFTWTGKTSTTLTGIPTTGSDALKAHPVGAYVQYDYSCAAGQCWYLTFSNILTELTYLDFEIDAVPAVEADIDYIDLHNGFIIFSAAISTISVVRCVTNYSFKTLQATGIEINKIEFTEEKTENRLEAVKALREFIAPNYLIQTIGDDKIWGRYVRQKATADYTLQLKTQMSYAEDSDIYTHTKFFGKSANPKNVCLEENVTLLAAGEEYSATVNDQELTYEADEGNYRVYITGLTAAGWISTENIVPVVRINGIPIDNKIHEVIMQQTTIIITTRTETRTGCHGVSTEQYVKTHTYYYYKVYFAGTNIVRDQPIYIYNVNGVLLYTLGPDDPRVNYEEGIWSVPGDEQNTTVETISTASYWLNYATSKLVIDFENVKFKIEKSLIPNVSKAKVTADFEYYSVVTAIDSAGNLFDGRWDTQVQTIFYAKPPSGYVYAILDLGTLQSIQAIDIIHGFFKPDERRSIDINNKYTLQYSEDNINYYSVCKEATNFNLAGGASTSFERDKLGDSFQARYFKLLINDMDKIEYGNGVWVAAFVEFACYSDVVLKGEAFLTPTTALNGNYAGSLLSGAGATVNLTVDDTSAFDDYGTAYLDEIAFTYGDTIPTQFLQCSGAGVYAAKSDGTRIAADIESDTRKYDDSGLLPKLGDKIYKVKDLNPYLDTQTRVDNRAGDFLTEFLKENVKASISLAYGPYLRVAQTVLLVDWTNNVSRNYFIDSLKGTEKNMEIVVAYYP